MIGAKKITVWIWKLIHMEGLWKGIFTCCWFTRRARNVWVEKQSIFSFSWDFDE
jgi:hypothetical protein